MGSDERTEHAESTGGHADAGPGHSLDLGQNGPVNRAGIAEDIDNQILCQREL